MRRAAWRVRCPASPVPGPAAVAVATGASINRRSAAMVTARAEAAAKSPAPATAKKAAAPPAPKAKAVTAPVVTLKAVFEQLAEAHTLPKKQAHELLADFVTAMTTHLTQGARIRMSGLGTLEVKSRAARMGRNPAT
jgi:DNA-binding protein HU-beta